MAKNGPHEFPVHGTLAEDWLDGCYQGTGYEFRSGTHIDDADDLMW